MAIKKEAIKNKKSKYNKAQMMALRDQEIEINKLVNQLDLLLLIYMLKSATNEDRAMSVAEVADQLDFLIPANSEIEPYKSYFSEPTLRRRLELFAGIKNSSGVGIYKNPDLTDEAKAKFDNLLSQIGKLLPYVFGGTITYGAAKGIQNGTNTRTNGSQKRFYFDPVLKPADLDLIYGSIHSSRYLSDAEKEYLLSRLSILAPYNDFSSADISDNDFTSINYVNNLPARPKKNKAATLPIDSSAILSNVEILHEAISEKYQVEVVYGTYDINEKTGKPGFYEKNADKPYVLNPYAMLWNDGEYYLIATHYNFKNPVHFRVDRIFSVRPHTKENKDGTLEIVKRKPVPDALKPFFSRKSGKSLQFDPIKYTNAFPGMIFHQDFNPVDCCFECTANTLQILIDNFGPNIRVSESPVKHKKNEVGQNGNPIHFLAATVSGIQYDNALSFTLSHAQNLTLLSPENLVDDVKKRLKEILKNYN